MKRKSKLALAIGVVVIALLAAACSGAPGQSVAQEEASPPTPVPTRVPTDTAEKKLDSGGSAATSTPVAEQPVPTEEPVETSQPDPTAPGAEPRLFTPSSRTALEATNPANVNLASGDLQLVEFFAFW